MVLELTIGSGNMRSKIKTLKVILWFITMILSVMALFVTARNGELTFIVFVISSWICAFMIITVLNRPICEGCNREILGTQSQYIVETNINNILHYHDDCKISIEKEDVG